VIVHGLDAYLQMLFIDNFIHSDLHPGNILYRHARPGERQKITILDAGMATTLEDEHRRNWIPLMQAIGDGDSAAAAEAVLRFSPANSPCADPDAFRSSMDSLFAAHCRGYGKNCQLDFVVRGILRAVYLNRVSIEGRYAELFTNVLCIEGLAHDLDPRFNLLDCAFPLLRAHQLLGDRTFRTIFSSLTSFAPRPFWNAFYYVNLYSGYNGNKLLRYQI
jgi:aarF domain-containing kinase